MSAVIPSSSPVDFRLVLAEELSAISPEGSAAQDQPRALSGLAFSGGGIRSATFNLGIIQALSELKLLRHFDYLSTVSGGGYIGGWLSAYIHRCAQGDVKQAEDKLHAGGQQECAVRFLRSYSNYLTPKLGLLSTDALTAIATYLRNLYLNLSMLLLALAVVLLIPRVLVWGVRWLAGWEGANPTVEGHSLYLYESGGFFLAMAMVFVGLNFGRGARLGEKPPFYAQQVWIVRLIVLPIMFSAWLLGYAIYVGSDQFVSVSTWIWMLGGAVAYLLPWCIGWVIGHWNLQNPAYFSPARIFWMVLYALLAAMLGGYLLSLFAAAASWVRQFNYTGSWIMSALGAALMLKLYSLTVVAHIGLMGRNFSNESREWWARLGGWLLMMALAWSVIFCIVFLAPAFFKWARIWLLGSGATAWIASTAIGIALGRSSKTSILDNQVWRSRIAAVTPYIFIIGLLGLLSWGVHELLLRFFCANCVQVIYAPNTPFLAILLDEAKRFKGVDPVGLAAFMAGCILIATVLAFRVDVNLFSIYYFYRQRLTRCYLGATRCKEREPHPFTGFDPQDDIHLAEFCRIEANGQTVCQRPYPIINTAVNMVHGKQLAWQERRAAAFAFTPLYSGYDFVEPDEKGKLVSCYRPTAKYMGGVHLGSAMSISGAAASPNMGFHSTPALCFLMTVFNVRLGHWSGNTTNSSTWRRHSPRFGGAYLFKEMLGLTDSDSPYINLSDGGHFENLGIYELVRRRCSHILVVDAGEDGQLTFDDLGNAIRKCYADFGVVINIDVDASKGKPDGQAGVYWALGDIHYPDAAPGTLVYIKPRLTGNEPADLLNYASKHPGFPHQPTSDQWFDESQFESYRKLGHWIGKEVLGPALDDTQQRRQASADTTPLLPYLFAVLRERKGSQAQAY